MLYVDVYVVRQCMCVQAGMDKELSERITHQEANEDPRMTRNKGAFVGDGYDKPLFQSSFAWDPSCLRLMGPLERSAGRSWVLAICGARSEGILFQSDFSL